MGLETKCAQVGRTLVLQFVHVDAKNCTRTKNGSILRGPCPIHPSGQSCRGVHLG